MRRNPSTIEAIVALDLRLQLEGLGDEVTGVAASAETAIELVVRRRPDLILMDVRLQGALDGIAAAELIRRDRDIPVIFLTSHSDDQTVRRAARTAPYGYLPSPIGSRNCGPAKRRGVSSRSRTQSGRGCRRHLDTRGGLRHQRATAAAGSRRTGLIPYGLLLTELMTNSLKHAFPGGRRGCVQVSLARRDEGSLLTVADDGVGFGATAEAAGRPASMGLQLAASWAADCSRQDPKAGPS